MSMVLVEGWGIHEVSEALDGTFYLHKWPGFPMHLLLEFAEKELVGKVVEVNNKRVGGMYQFQASTSFRVQDIKFSKGRPMHNENQKIILILEGKRVLAGNDASIPVFRNSDITVLPGFSEKDDAVFSGHETK